MKTRKDLIMTEGTIWRLLIRFSIPLLIGNIFQMLYSTVDSIVVGNFVGKTALAAIGSTGSIINTIIGFFVGLATGAGVVVSQYFGARDDEGVSRAVHTSLMMTAIFSVVVVFTGILLTPALLAFMKTPIEVIPEATEYLTIYFAGAAGLMFYNIGSGILRAVGDSRRPLYFLIFSSVANILLDLLFVVVFDLKVAGVAYATILAQFLSAGLVLLTLAREKANYRLIFRKLLIDPKIIGQIIRIGFPTALQGAITSFSNVYVQSYINHFGDACMAGWSAFNRVDQFVLLPIQTLGMAVTTFVGQNIGAGNIKRARRGGNVGFFISLGTTAVLMVPSLLLAPQLTMVFNQDPEVVKYGTQFIMLNMPFMLTVCANQIYAGSLRGAGDSKAPMFIMIFSFIIFRQLYLFTVSQIVESITWVSLGYPFGWIMCSILISIYYRFSHWETKRVVLAEKKAEQPQE